LPDAASCGQGLCMTETSALCEKAAAPHPPKVPRPLPCVSSCQVERAGLA
jgi:hypothetical protein